MRTDLDIEVFENLSTQRDIDIDALLGSKKTKQDTLVVSKPLAVDLGFTKAIVFQRIQFWINFNHTKYESSKKQKDLYHNDSWFMFSTYEEMQKRDFPFLNKVTVMRIVDSLVKKKLLIKANHNKRKADRTTWLAINEEGYKSYINSDEYKKAIEQSSGTLSINKTLARYVGLNESLVLRSIRYWSEKNKIAAGGRYWTFNNYNDWNQKTFPFLSAHTLRRAVESLEERSLIESSTQKRYKNGLQGKWYSINYDDLRDYLSKEIDAATAYVK